MSLSFPRVTRGARGYNPQEVDAFIAQARIAYDTNVAGAETISSQAIRGTSFNLAKGGYSTRHVDAALERLETAFADRERVIALAAVGEPALLEKAQSLASELQNRFARPAKKRFRRVGAFARGYKTTDVDAFTAKAEQVLSGTGELSVSDIRSVTFRSSLRGYNEVQVDATLDALIELFLTLGYE